MIEGLRAPEKNRHGLVIPPDPARITPAREEYYRHRIVPDRHHIYFPRVVFKEAGSLPFDFREHRFNSIWLPRFQHDRLHKRYSPLVYKYPDYMMPPGDVMATFLDEAHLLDELDVCVKAVDMIDEALYDGRVKHVNHTLDNREQRLQVIETVVSLVPDFEIVTPFIARTALAGANRVLLAS